MRSITFGNFNSWDNWGMTLTGYSLSSPVYKGSFVSVPGRDGDLDLSTTLTDGEPRYENRNFESRFEISSGTRENRETLFNTIVNELSGRQINIITPDDLTHYISGRADVAIEYNDPAHGAIVITANCNPWRYANTSKTVSLTASSTQKTATLSNAGRRLLVPVVTISGTNAAVELVFGDNAWNLSAGTFSLPDLLLQRGNNSLKYKGTGNIAISYREAVL